MPNSLGKFEISQSDLEGLCSFCVQFEGDLEFFVVGEKNIGLISHMG